MGVLDNDENDTTQLGHFISRAVATVWTVARSRCSARKIFGVMNINEVIIVNNRVIDCARQQKIL